MANRTMKTIHFPESGMISVMAVNGGGLHKTQIGLIGREGMTGMPIIFGSKHSPFDTQRPRWTPGRREPPELGAKKDGLSIVFTKPRASLASKLPNSSLRSARSHSSNVPAKYFALYGNVPRTSGLPTEPVWALPPLVGESRELARQCGRRKCHAAPPEASAVPG